MQDPISVLTVLDGYLIPGFAIGTSLAVPHVSGLYSLLVGLGTPFTDVFAYFPFVQNQSYEKMKRNTTTTETLALFNASYMHEASLSMSGMLGPVGTRSDTAFSDSDCSGGNCKGRGWSNWVCGGDGFVWVINGGGGNRLNSLVMECQYSNTYWTYHGSSVSNQDTKVGNVGFVGLRVTWDQYSVCDIDVFDATQTDWTTTIMVEIAVWEIQT